MQSQRSKSFWLWLAVGATAVVVLAIVGLVATDGFGTSDPDVAEQAGRQSPADRDEVAVTGKALQLGDVATISRNYKVAVSDLTLYKGETAQYLAATVKAEYVGGAKGEPWADLTVAFADADARVSEESDCPIDVDDADEPPPLDAGEVATYTVCMSLPNSAIAGGKVSVEEAFAKGRKSFWSTKGATTEKITSVRPPSSGGQASSGGSRPAYRAPNDSDDEEVDWDEFDEDVEETNDWIEDMDKLVEQCKKASSCDDDKVEEYEDWRDDYKDRLEEYEDWKDRTGR